MTFFNDIKPVQLGMLAALLPARRALAVDPLILLRDE